MCVNAVRRECDYGIQLTQLKTTLVTQPISGLSYYGETITLLKAFLFST